MEVLERLGARLSALGDLAGYALLRAVCGAFLVAHGWPKWAAGVETFAANGLARRGIEPALPLAWMVVSIEVVGGALIAIGLLTRPAAALAAGHLLFITLVVSWPLGFAWTRGGWEYPAMWSAVLLYIALKGGGAVSAGSVLARVRPQGSGPATAG
jgi:putative oxidoreductase